MTIMSFFELTDKALKWKSVLQRDKLVHTPLHLFVVLSRIAFVDTILPYLEEKQKGEVIVSWIMHQSEPVVKHTKREG